MGGVELAEGRVASKLLVTVMSHLAPCPTSGRLSKRLSMTFIPRCQETTLLHIQHIAVPNWIGDPALAAATHIMTAVPVPAASVAPVGPADRSGPTIRVHARLPCPNDSDLTIADLNADSAKWRWVCCLEIPCETLNILQFSSKPLFNRMIIHPACSEHSTLNQQNSSMPGLEVMLHS